MKADSFEANATRRVQHHTKRLMVMSTFDKLQVAIFKGEDEEVANLMDKLNTLTGGGPCGSN